MELFWALGQLLTSADAQYTLCVALQGAAELHCPAGLSLQAAQAVL